MINADNIGYIFELIVLAQMSYIVYLAFNQPDDEREKIAKAYMLSLMVYLIITKFVLVDYGSFWIFTNGTLMFLTAGILNVFIVGYIASFKNAPCMGSDLQAVSAVSLIYNAGGWFLYQIDTLVPAYSLLFIAIYAWAIYILRRGEPNIGRKHDRMVSRFRSFRVDDFTRNILNNHH